MPIATVCNTIANPGKGALVESVVLEEIGDRAGQWLVRISEPQLSPEYDIGLDGPRGFKWSRRFFGIEEQDERCEFIRRAVRDAIAATERL